MNDFVFTYFISEVSIPFNSLQSIDIITGTACLITKRHMTGQKTKFGDLKSLAYIVVEKSVTLLNL